jgi:predicted metal-dependent HD superfamily phosphohydrolase
VPPLSFLLADQVEPPRHIARHLGLSLRTLQRYAASGNAPRAIYLALWFESRWGMAALHAQAFNEAQHARAWVASLERECERLRRVIRSYEHAQAQPAANASTYHSV